MKIYVGHPSSIEYKEELYEPLENSKIGEKHEVVFPHQNSEEQFDSKSFLNDECDLMVAEVSNPSTGLGIELGWADVFDVPVLLVKRADAEVSNSLSVISEDIIVYEDSDELAVQIGRKLSVGER